MKFYEQITCGRRAWLIAAVNEPLGKKYVLKFTRVPEAWSVDAELLLSRVTEVFEEKPSQSAAANDKEELLRIGEYTQQRGIKFEIATNHRCIIITALAEPELKLKS